MASSREYREAIAQWRRKHAGNDLAPDDLIQVVRLLTDAVGLSDAVTELGQLLSKEKSELDKARAQIAVLKEHVEEHAAALLKAGASVSAINEINRELRANVAALENEVII